MGRFRALGGSFAVFICLILLLAGADGGARMRASSGGPEGAPPPNAAHAYGRRRWTWQQYVLAATGGVVMVVFLHNALTKDYKGMGRDYLRSRGRERQAEQVFPKTAREAIKEKMTEQGQLEYIAAELDDLRVSVKTLQSVVSQLATAAGKNYTTMSDEALKQPQQQQEPTGAHIASRTRALSAPSDPPSSPEPSHLLLRRDVSDGRVAPLGQEEGDVGVADGRKGGSGGDDGGGVLRGGDDMRRYEDRVARGSRG